MASKEEKLSKAETSSRSEPGKTSNAEFDELQELYRLMQAEGLDAIELREEGFRIKLGRGLFPAISGPGHAAPRPKASDTLPAPPSEAGAAAVSPANLIPTPLAGIFYRAASPNSAPFVKEGDRIEAGQTLCIVEAMKVMNEIKAESACRVVKILAENSRPVSAGQPLFSVEKT